MKYCLGVTIYGEIGFVEIIINKYSTDTANKSLHKVNVGKKKRTKYDLYLVEKKTHPVTVYFWQNMFWEKMGSILYMAIVELNPIVQFMIERLTFPNKFKTYLLQNFLSPTWIFSIMYSSKIIELFSKYVSIN